MKASVRYEQFTPTFSFVIPCSASHGAWNPGQLGKHKETGPAFEQSREGTRESKLPVQGLSAASTAFFSLPGGLCVGARAEGTLSSKSRLEARLTKSSCRKRRKSLFLYGRRGCRKACSSASGILSSAIDTSIQSKHVN